MRWRTKSVGGRMKGTWRSANHTQLAQSASTTNTIFFIKWRCLHETCHNQKGRPSILGPGPFRTTCVPHLSLATTTTFDHGCESQTAEKSRDRPLLAGCGHRSPESREGWLLYTTSAGRIWFRQCSSDDDQGTPSTLFRWCILDSHVTRTP